MSEVQQQIQQMLGFNGVTNPNVDVHLINLPSPSSACRRILWVWMEPYSSPQPLRKTTNWRISSMFLGITIINLVDTQRFENSFIMKTVCLCVFFSKFPQINAFMYTSVVCREMELENPAQRSYLIPYVATHQAAWLTSDWRKRGRIRMINHMNHAVRWQWLPPYPTWVPMFQCMYIYESIILIKIKESDRHKRLS